MAEAGPSANPTPAMDLEDLGGRPRVDVDLDDVEFLCSLRLSLTKVAALLGVSRSTIYRRMAEEGRAIGGYTAITDNALDLLIRGLKSDHPHDGEVMMAGHLTRIGVRITRARLRASIHRVDPQGVAERSRRVIQRRVYSVPHANYIWHIDSNHKLIRWRMVIHGAVDGYSRKILYLGCANNNKASTVVSMFSHAAYTFGIPDKVRSDKGGENIDVWQYMLHYHSMQSSCVLTGSSTHNERIERMWCDVFRCVGQIFYSLLYKLEDDGFLDPLNHTDLFCIHYAILPEVNRCLQEFTDSWNNHCLSTASNITPEALFAIGLLEKQQNETAAEPNHPMESDFSSDGLEPNGIEDVTVVDVPNTPANLCSSLQQDLSRISVDTNDFGLQRYMESIHIVGRHIQYGCNTCFVS